MSERASKKTKDKPSEASSAGWLDRMKANFGSLVTSHLKSAYIWTALMLEKYNKVGIVSRVGLILIIRLGARSWLRRLLYSVLCSRVSRGLRRLKQSNLLRSEHQN